MTVFKEGKTPTGWYLYQCGDCKRTWRSIHGNSVVLNVKVKVREEDIAKTSDMDRACPKCGVPARRVVCKIEYTEDEHWRERWPKLPKGVTVQWYSKLGFPPRFKAVYKGQYLGMFVLIDEAVEAIEWAKSKREDSQSKGG